MKIWYVLDDAPATKLDLADDDDDAPPDVDDLVKAIIRVHNLNCLATDVQIFQMVEHDLDRQTEVDRWSAVSSLWPYTVYTSSKKKKRKTSFDVTRIVADTQVEAFLPAVATAPEFVCDELYLSETKSQILNELNAHDSVDIRVPPHGRRAMQ
jgi:hypothetical protein